MSFNRLFTGVLFSAIIVSPIGTPTYAQQHTDSSTVETPQSTRDSVWIALHVKDLQTQTPIAHARIDIQGRTVSMRANDRGTAFLRGTPGEIYRVTVRAIGFEPFKIDVPAPATTAPSGMTDIWMFRTSLQAPEVVKHVDGKATAQAKNN